jgi:hypothetical protein
MKSMKIMKVRKECTAPRVRPRVLVRHASLRRTAMQRGLTEAWKIALIESDQTSAVATRRNAIS